MKFSNVILALVLVFAIVCAVAFNFSATGSTRMLETMQAIRQGMTMAQVRAIMAREPQIASADQIPEWIEEVAGDAKTGEFWYFYMGYPPRNLIIYFDETGHVVYTTWAST